MRPDLGALCLICLASATAADPVFRPVSAPHHVYDGGWEHFVGGGLASFDCNGDHLPELLAAGGSNPAQLLINRSLRDGDLKFEAKTPAVLAQTGVIGAYPLDIDSDGLTDLAILRVGKNQLLRGLPDCEFAPFDDLGFQSGDHWTTAFSATWERGHVLPTLAFGNYVNRADPDGPFRACDSNDLYRPLSAQYTTPIVLTPGYCALSMLFSDWNRTGSADLRVSNDRHYYVDQGQEQLWRMAPVPQLFTADEGWSPFQVWGMGIASRDISGDGFADVFLTSMGDQRLQWRVPGAAPTYRDASYDQGTTAQRPYTGGDGRPSTGWHSAFGDVQNDGRDDIFVSKGNVEQMPDSAMKDPNSLLVQGPDGRFVERGETAGIASLHRGRGAVLADLNLDGRIDLAVVNRRAPLEIYQNVTSKTGHWLAVSLMQPTSNRQAVGAWIELDTGSRIISREITVGGGHAGGSAGPEHFGLGDSETVRLRVFWPDGRVSGWVETDVDKVLVGARGHANAVTLSAY